MVSWRVDIVKMAKEIPASVVKPDKHIFPLIVEIADVAAKIPALH
jgi:hypothetical protein